MRGLRFLLTIFFTHDDERRRPRIAPFVIVSLLMHVFVVAIMQRLQTQLPTETPIMVEVVPIDEALQGREIADIAKPDVEQRPAKARFMGQYDSTVNREAVAQGPRGKTSEAAGQKGQKANEKNPQASEKKDLFQFDQKLFAQKQTRGEGGQEGGVNPLEDFYPDFQHGAHTYLNVLRYPDIEYFVRLKRAFKIAFNPGPVLQRHFFQNQISRGSIEVVLGVSVDATGELKELLVLRSSGVEAYDEEGLRTVRVSSPFSSPPQKFLDDDGLLRMSWTFTVYL